MSFQFGPPDPPPPRMVRRPPPNYFSSATRWRLFVIVAGVLLMTSIVSRLNNPRVQHLLGLAERPIAGGPPLTENEIAGDEVDTRLVQASPRESTSDVQVIRASEPKLEPSSTATLEISEGKGTPERSLESNEVAVLEAAWRDAWIALLRDCPAADENRLYDRLRVARGHGRALDHQGADETAEATAWKARVAAWDTDWKTYVKQARAGLASLSPEEHAHWDKVLDGVGASWLALWRPLLETLGQERTESPELARLVELLQEVADEKSLQAVQDDTVWRGSETNIWFRLVERIRATDPRQLRQESLGPTGYLQLFKQPSYYRGKVVTVRGTVRLAYRVDALPNAEGVKEYTLMWLHPAGGPSSPMVIYALETPEGFPTIRHRDRDRGTTALHEEVEFTGYFFKRWAYEGRDDIHVAPLVLAVSPRWVAPSGDETAGPEGWTIAIVIFVSAAAGIGAAIFAFRRTPGGSAAA